MPEPIQILNLEITRLFGQGLELKILGVFLPTDFTEEPKSKSIISSDAPSIGMLFRHKLYHLINSDIMPDANFTIWPNNTKRIDYFRVTQPKMGIDRVLRFEIATSP